MLLVGGEKWDKIVRDEDDVVYAGSRVGRPKEWREEIGVKMYE